MMKKNNEKNTKTIMNKTSRKDGSGWTNSCKYDGSWSSDRGWGIVAAATIAVITDVVVPKCRLAINRTQRSKYYYELLCDCYYETQSIVLFAARGCIGRRKLYWNCCGLHENNMGDVLRRARAMKKISFATAAKRGRCSKVDWKATTTLTLLPLPIA